MPPFESSQKPRRAGVMDGTPVNTLLEDSSFFPFLALPRELRDIIYDYALTVPSPLKWHPAENYKFGKDNLSIGLLRVSQQVYREAAPVLYSANELEFRLPGSGKIFRAVASPEYSALVKSVSLVFTEGHIVLPEALGLWAQYLGFNTASSIKNDFPNLKQLRLRVVCCASKSLWYICRFLRSPSKSVPQSTTPEPDSARLHRLRRELWRLLSDREGLGDQEQYGRARLFVLQFNIADLVNRQKSQEKRAEKAARRKHMALVRNAFYKQKNPYNVPATQGENSNQETPGHAIGPGHPSDTAHATEPRWLPDDTFPPSWDADIALLHPNTPSLIERVCSILERNRETDVKVAVVEVLSLSRADMATLLQLFPDFTLLENGNARVKINRYQNTDVFLELVPKD